MYTVQIYCVVPSYIEITDELRYYLWRHDYTDGDFTTRIFETQDDFFSFVRGFDYRDRNNAQRNHFLDATMCSTKETRRHKRYPTTHRNPLRRASKDNAEYSCCYIGYFTTDSNGRVIDLRNYTDELYAFDIERYKVIKNIAWRIKCSVNWEKRDAAWEKTQKLLEGHDYWSFFRSIRTTQERRFAAIPEHKPFVRGRRSYANLPNAYDDYYFHREKSWKARNKKASRQWEVSLAKHIDTIKASSCWSDVFESFTIADF